MRAFNPKILFFINGPTPSDDEKSAAREFGPGVAFRNANAVPSEMSPGSLEPAHGVAGDVPVAYSRYPKGFEGLEKWRSENPDAFNDGNYPADLKPAPNDVLPSREEIAADYKRRHETEHSTLGAAAGGQGASTQGADKTTLGAADTAAKSAAAERQAQADAAKANDGTKGGPIGSDGPGTQASGVGGAAPGTEGWGGRTA